MSSVPYETPIYFNTGALVSDATSISVAWPAHEDGDIGIIVVNTGAGDISGNHTEATTSSDGWAVAADALVAYGFNASYGCTVTAFICRATSGAMPNAVIDRGALGDYIVGRMITVRGASRAGAASDAIHAVAVSEFLVVDATTQNSVIFPAVTTTIGKCLIVGVAGDGTDGTSLGATTITNANLRGSTERIDDGTVTGSGGTIYIFTGSKDSAGNTGTTDVSLGSGSRRIGRITLAIMPPQVEEVPIPDETAPTIANLEPADGNIRAQTVIEFDLLDELELGMVAIVASFADGSAELVHDGEEFRGSYRGSANARTAITDGFHYAIRRDGGWEASPTIEWFVVDAAGNIGVIV